MTISNVQRNENTALALRLMLESLIQGHPYAWEEFDGDIEPFNIILRTTWSVLQRKGLVKSNGLNRYELTASGWIAALKATGSFDSPEMKEKAGKLAAALKRRVDGRKQDGWAERTELAEETGLEEAFIYDVIDSHLLRYLFGMIDAHWAPDDRMNNYIVIPVDFGHKL